MSRWFKDPDDVLDYAFDFATEWLAASETIDEHTVTVPDGITKDSSTESDGVVTVWLSGGTGGDSYDVACRITTNQGRTIERTQPIEVRDR